MQYIIRLFPEITIKSTPVRKRWSKKLVDNLRILARRIHERSTVVLDWDRIVLKVHSDDAQIAAQITEMLRCTPGIAHFSRVHAYPYETMHDIYEHVFSHWRGRLEGKTFCVRVKRSGKHEFSSIDLERYIGGGINQHTPTAGVKLKDPDETILVEVKDDTCYVVEARSEGLGGFPLGTQEDVLSLISGGFDSSIASYMLMRRGMKTHFCFFNLGGKEHELAVKEVAFYLWNKFGSSHRVRFFAVPFEEVVAEILEHISPANMGVVLKRMMYRAADAIAKRGEFDAIVTGEAISQVSSQTLPNLSAIERVTDRLVLRPLITMDKPEIIRIARQIGTEAFSAAIPEYCGVISVKPSSRVKLDKLEAEEALCDAAVLERAIAGTVTQSIDAVMQDVGQYRDAPQVEAVDVLPQAATVIDIRHPHEAEIAPLTLPEHTILTIPFYTLNDKAQELDKNTPYFLYCDKGVMSQLHAAHLRDQGLSNVGVYRPGQ